MNSKTLKLVSRRLFLSILLFSMMGCGGDKVTAPYGSTITINPASISYSFDPAAPVCDHPDAFTITAVGPDGEPMNNVELYVDYAWAVGHGYTLVQFYDGATKVDAPVKIVTDHSGNAQLSLTINRCTRQYSGDMSVRSSNAYATAAIAVN